MSDQVTASAENPRTNERDHSLDRRIRIRNAALLRPLKAAPAGLLATLGPSRTRPARVCIDNGEIEDLLATCLPRRMTADAGTISASPVASLPTHSCSPHAHYYTHDFPLTREMPRALFCDRHLTSDGDVVQPLI